MDDFKPFEDKLAGLISSLSPGGRRRLTVDIAKQLRQRQQQRIKAQKSPDGIRYTPRNRQPIKSKKGRVKQEMFAKLRTSRFIKAKGNDSMAVVEFTGKVQRIAQIHQLGLVDKPGRNSVAVKYPKRELLGLSDEDQQLIENYLINFINSF